jgi:hypothetical protein
MGHEILIRRGLSERDDVNDVWLVVMSLSRVEFRFVGRTESEEENQPHKQLTYNQYDRDS